MTRSHTNRRQFLKVSALAGVGVWSAGRLRADTSPNDKIRFACVGVGGKGKEEARDCARFGDVVAICDIDDDVLGKIGEAHPDAKRFQDWRDMFDELAGGIDAVTISTPDHTHAVIAAAAMRLGKPVYVQKPLTHDLYEARMLGQIARETEVATQMGNQGTAGSKLRRLAAMIKAGVLGPIKEVHVWTDRPIWPQGGERSEPKAVPKQVHWNLFLGPVQYRPYGDNYHPFGWRGWWDFGTGSLGDMACHTVNLPFMALDLRNPISVQAETTGHNRDSYPSKSRVEYEFAATNRPALKLFWSDGGVKPSRDLLAPFEAAEAERAAAEAKESKKSSDDKDADEDHADEKASAAAESDAKSASKKGRSRAKQPAHDSGCLFIGEKGMLLAPGDYAEGKIQFLGAEEIDVEFPSSPGHFAEWVEAIKGGPQAVSNLPDYAVPLTETVLLGNLAIWAANEPNVPGKKIEWDAEALKATNAPELAEVIRREYHNGYTL